MYDDTIAAYEHWLLSDSSRSVDSRTNNTAKNSETAATKKALRKEAAIKRSQLQPAQKKVQQTERAVNDLEGRLAHLQTDLADDTLYLPEEKNRLTLLLSQERELKQQIADAEEQWLAAQEALEALEVDLLESSGH